MEHFVFTHHNERCHAKIVNDVPLNAYYIGRMDNYHLFGNIGIFDAYGFYAVPGTIKATIRTSDGLRAIIYSYDVLDLLKTDDNVEFVIDNVTGELLYQHIG